MKKFCIEIHMSATLDETALWPDGAGPKNPTKQDVLDLIADEGGAVRILQDWNLDDHLDLDVFEVKPIKKAEPVK